MKGRTQAVFAVVFATGTVLFAWVGAAVIALVTLRKGTAQGSYVLFWGLIPATFVAAAGDTGPITTLLGVALAAAVLRVTGSWSWALMTAVISGLLTAYVLLTVGAGYIELFLQVFSELAKQPEMVSSQQLAETVSDSAVPVLGPAATANPFTAHTIAGILGLGNAFSTVMCLMLARWWQAILYNPGGFRTEFHQLRLSPQVTIVLLAMGIAVSLMGPDYSFWAIIFAVPFTFAGFALIHGLAGQWRIKGNWLVLVYCSWVVLPLVKAIILILAVADSWLNFRKRLAANGPSDDKSGDSEPGDSDND